MDKPANNFFDQLANLLVPKRQERPPETITNERILHELIACFDASLGRESIGTSLLFDANYIIILHPTSYAERLAALPVIVNEAVTAFYDRINRRKGPKDTIISVASHWHFKFGPGTEFDGRPIGLADVEVIGSLTGASLEGDNPPDDRPDRRLKATRKVKNTNVYQKLDMNLPNFSHIDFRESGAFAVRINPILFKKNEPVEPVRRNDKTPEQPNAARPNAGQSNVNVTRPAPVQPKPAPAPARKPDALARIDCYLGDQDKEETYWMKDREVVVARKEPENEPFTNYLRLTSPYVSNPHARIRYDEGTGQFQLASFSRHETRLNEQVVERSEPTNPVWVPLPDRAQILLNGVVTLSFQSNL